MHRLYLHFMKLYRFHTVYIVLIEINSRMIIYTEALILSIGFYAGTKVVSNVRIVRKRKKE